MQPNAMRCKWKLSQGRQTVPFMLAQVRLCEVFSRAELPVLDRSRLLSADCVCRCRKARSTLDLFDDMHVCNEHLRVNINGGIGLQPAGASLGEPPANPQSAPLTPVQISAFSSAATFSGSSKAAGRQRRDTWESARVLRQMNGG